MAKKHQAAYLDEVETEKLSRIAEYWGTSLSGAIKRLIREFKIEDD
jgi:hypothetical protein